MDAEQNLRIVSKAGDVFQMSAFQANRLAEPGPMLAFVGTHKEGAGFAGMRSPPQPTGRRSRSSHQSRRSTKPSLSDFSVTTAIGAGEQALALNRQIHAMRIGRIKRQPVHLLLAELLPGDAAVLRPEQTQRGSGIDDGGIGRDPGE